MITSVNTSAEKNFLLIQSYKSATMAACSEIKAKFRSVIHFGLKLRGKACMGVAKQRLMLKEMNSIK